MNRSATILTQALGFALVLGFLGYKIGEAKGWATGFKEAHERVRDPKSYPPGSCAQQYAECGRAGGHLIGIDRAPTCTKSVEVALPQGAP
jgi:hypothetical protein